MFCISHYISIFCSIEPGRVWHERSVTETMSRKRNQAVMVFDPALADIFEALYQRATREHLWEFTDLRFKDNN